MNQTLDGVPEEGADALARRLLDSTGDEPNLRPGAQRRADEHLVGTSGPGLLDTEVEELLSGQREMGGVGPEEQLAVGGARVGEDQRLDLPHSQRRDRGGEAVGGLVVLAALLGELLEQLEGVGGEGVTEDAQDLLGDDAL